MILLVRQGYFAISCLARVQLTNSALYLKATSTHSIAITVFTGNTTTTAVIAGPCGYQ